VLPRLLPPAAVRVVEPASRGVCLRALCAFYLQLVPSLSPDERPHDPYIEPWHSSPHMWDPETEFVTGSYAKGGLCQVRLWSVREPSGRVNVWACERMCVPFLRQYWAVG
jgi:hypothetical protein